MVWTRPATIVALLVGNLLLLGGCGQSERSRLYTLSDLSATQTSMSLKSDLSVGVGPITMPQYLDRPQIVVRQSENRFDVAEFDRWAEPIQEIVARTLVENLSKLLTSDRVYRQPGNQRATVDLNVRIDFFRFDLTATGGAQLTARWAIYSDEFVEPLAEGKTVAEGQGGAPGDYETMVALLSELLGELSADIAKSIADLQS